MATEKNTAATDSSVNEPTSDWSEASEHHSDDEKSKPDAFIEWYQEVLHKLEVEKDKNKLDTLKKQLIQAEEMYESLKEGYEIESRVQETEKAIEDLKKRLNIPKETSKNVQTNISVSQESVLQKFEEMYAQWNRQCSETDRASDMCKMHEECHKYCSNRFENQLKELLKVATPQSRNQIFQSDNGHEKQIIQEAYKELARNTVGTELKKLKEDGSKAIKTNKELKQFLPEFLEICWITLLLKEPMSFEFDSQKAKEGTFEGTTQDMMAFVIKPAVCTNKGTIKIRGMVKQKQDDAKKERNEKTEDNSGGAQPEHNAKRPDEKLSFV